MYAGNWSERKPCAQREYGACTFIKRFSDLIGACNIGNPARTGSKKLFIDEERQGVVKDKVAWHVWLIC